MIKYLECYSDNRNTHKNRRTFNVSAYTVTSIYLGNLETVVTGKVDKLNIILHEILLNKEQLSFTDYKVLELEERRNLIAKGLYFHQNYIDNLIDVVSIHRRFDFETYFKQPDVDKKRMLLDELHAGVMHVAQHLGWDVAPLQTAYQRCLDANLQNHFVAKRLGEKTSPNRQHKAHVWVEYDLTEIRLYLRITDKTNNIVINQHFYTLNGLDETKLYPDDVMPILHGKLSWQGIEAIVHDKKGNEIIRTSVQKIATNM